MTAPSLKQDNERYHAMRTGYATISRNILNGLAKKGYECHFMAHNLPSQPLPPGLTLKDGLKFNFSIYGSGREAYCKDLIIPRIQEIQPDYFGILLDTFMLFPWIMNYNFSPAKSFFYFPSDGGGGLPSGCEQVLRTFTKSVAMSKFAQEQANKVHGLSTEYIPHAVDTKLYVPFSEEERQKCKREMIVKTVNGELVKGFLNNKFVVGTVARNQGRKMLDRTIKAFSIFCKDKPNAVLYLHLDPDDAASVFDMRLLIRRHNLENRVVFSKMKFFENFEYSEMPGLYNCFDVFLLTTSGEGWGVPTSESLACGIPAVVTDYTTTQELLVENGECGIPVPIICELTGSWTVERGVMDDVKCAEALDKLYYDPELRKHYGEVGRSKMQKYYSWDVVIPAWDDFLQRL